MAATLLRQGKIAEAINGYQEAVAVRPDYVIAHSNLLLAYNYQNHKDPEWLFPDTGIGPRHTFFRRGITLF